MLRRSFEGKHEETSKAELRKRLWGIPGRYMLEGMLLGFVEEMGHEYKHLLEGAIKEKEPVVDQTGLVVANTDIRESKLDREDQDEEDSDQDEED